MILVSATAITQCSTYITNLPNETFMSQLGPNWILTHLADSWLVKDLLGRVPSQSDASQSASSSLQSFSASASSLGLKQDPMKLLQAREMDPGLLSDTEVVVRKIQGTIVEANARSHPSGNKATFLVYHTATRE